MAIWAAVLFGILEGVLLDVAFFFPKLLAPYKASLHQLYVAPLVDLVFFLAAVPPLLIGLAATARWTAKYQPRLVFGAFTLAGATVVLVTLRILHWWAAVALALGITMAAVRALEGREDEVVAWLRARLALLPVAIAVAALGVTLWGIVREHMLVAGLAAVGTLS